MIGIFGGTFDPVHHGHLRAALEVKEIFALQQVRLIPCAQPAHRKNPLSSPEARLQMLKLAIESQPDLDMDRREIDREGISYMVDTLSSMRIEYSDIPLLLFIGTDAFEGLTGWHQWQKLFELGHIVVITRPGYEKPVLSDFFSARLSTDKSSLQNDKAGRLYFQTVTQLEISATAIRKMFKSGHNPGYLLPDNVIDFIKRNKLYLS